MRLCFLFLLVLSLRCETQPLAVTRPKIGLVLEGGGALGLAHIGILEWMEEHRVPIDLITGTSMGALIGGLYASGMSTRELRELITSIDWNLTLGGQVPFNALSYRRKEDRIAYPNRLEFGLRNGVQFPAGLNSGHQIGLILSRATLGYPNLASFDDLPVPFRAVAVELISGKEEVFDKGSLADALRASISMPAIFAPAVRDGKVYTDGGSLNNLPVDVAKRMGADVLIAVHLATGPVDPKQLSTLTGTLGRTVAIVVSNNELRNMQLADILITADLSGFTSADYLRAGAIIAKGRDAAAAKNGILSRLQLDAASYQALLDQRQRARTAIPRQVSTVEVEGTTRQLERSIEKTLKPFLNTRLQTSLLERELTRIVGLGRYDSLAYRIEDSNGTPALWVRAQEKLHGPPFFQPAVEIDGKDQSNVGFLFLSRFTALDLGGFRSEWRTDVAFGSRYGIASEYYRPLTESSRVFLAPRAFAQNSRYEVYENQDRIADYRLREYGLGGDVGVNFSRFAELRAGYTLGRLSAERDIGSPVFPDIGFRNDVATFRFAYEGQDDAVIARRGIRILASLKHFPESTLPALSQAELRITAAKPVSPRASFLGGVSGGTSFDSRDAGIRGFSFGAPIRLGAYGPNELRGHEYFLFTAGYLRELITLPPLAGDKLYWTTFYQAGRMGGAQFHRGVPMSLSSVLVAKTLLGPIYLGGSWGDRGHRRWYFGLGRVF